MEAMETAVIYRPKDIGDRFMGSTTLKTYDVEIDSVTITVEAENMRDALVAAITEWYDSVPYPGEDICRFDLLAREIPDGEDYDE